MQLFHRDILKNGISASTSLTILLFQLVELKNGETYNGHLVSCDTWMNINLREVICTSKDGDRFWRMPECYIRGSTIKYLRIPDEVIDMVKEEAQQKQRNRQEMNKNRGQNQRGGAQNRGPNRGGFQGRGGGGVGGANRNMNNRPMGNKPNNTNKLNK